MKRISSCSASRRAGGRAARRAGRRSPAPPRGAAVGRAPGRRSSWAWLIRPQFREVDTRLHRYAAAPRAAAAGRIVALCPIQRKPARTAKGAKGCERQSGGIGPSGTVREPRRGHDSALPGGLLELFHRRRRLGRFVRCRTVVLVRSHPGQAAAPPRCGAGSARSALPSTQSRWCPLPCALPALARLARVPG